MIFTSILCVVKIALATAYSIGTPINAIIVGGSSGMGKATAVSTVMRSGNVLIVSRSKEKLDKSSFGDSIQSRGILLHERE